MVAEDFALLTNRDVLAVNSASSHNRQVSASCDGPQACKYVWAALAPDGGRFIALMNIGDDAQEVSVPLPELGIAPTAKCVVRDLWRGEEAPHARRRDVLAANLPAQNGAELYHLQCEKEATPSEMTPTTRSV